MNETDRTHICKIGDIDWSGADAPEPSDRVCGSKLVEPWLSAIIQAEHVSLLVGNGLTTAAVTLAGGTPVPMDGGLGLGADLGDAIEREAAAEATRTGRGTPNIEDRLRVALAVENGLRVLNDARAQTVSDAITRGLTELCAAVLRAEEALNAIPATGMDRYTPAGYLVAFILAFASRTPTRDRLHIFTTNYDRLIEDACDRAGLRILDRFVGSLRPRFRSSRLDVDIHYNPPGIRGEPRFLEGVARLTKMHGSIDWQAAGGEVVRQHVSFGDPSAASRVATDSLLVYPQPSKDVETGYFPYADLFRDFSAALCRPNSVLVTYGYGFGDDHINRVLRDMLMLASTHLVVISWDHAEGRIQRFIEQCQAGPQVSLLIGSHFGDLRTLVDSYLPRPSIDDVTWRRAHLLQGRAIPPASTDGRDVDTQ